MDSPHDRSATNPRDSNDLVDSTGDDEAQAAVRTLLARLPEPGPMPPEVAARIQGALADAATQRARDQGLFDELGFAEPASPPPSLERPRWRASVPRRWPILAAAAAAATVLGVAAVVGLVQIRRGVEGLAAVPGASAPPVAGTVHVQVSDTAYTKDTLATGARALLSSPGPEASSGDAPSVGPLATQTGVEACVAALGDSDATAVSIDLATYDAQPAAIVVVRDGSTTKAYAVERGCRAGDPKIIQDAVPVP